MSSITANNITSMQVPHEDKARVVLDVVIVGAGIGGVAAAVTLCRRGHNVVLLESAPRMLEIGAGIQIAPNMLVLLDRWGVGERVRKAGVALESVHVLRWQNGNELNKAPVNMSFGEQFVVHRADLHNALLSRALEMKNFELRLNSTVVGVNLANATAVLSTGEMVKGDVLLGADGIKSLVRKLVLSDDTDAAIPTGDAVYRIMLRRDQMLKDDQLEPFIEERKAFRWVGPGGHVVAYPVRDHELYNVVLAHPDRGGLEESWTKSGSKKDLLKEYEGWDPRLVKMIDLVDDGEVLEWKLCSHPPLKTWISGRVALLGDACHPMLPYVAQGAAQAVEDAAALGVILSSISTKGEIGQALRIYEGARKARVEKVQGLGKQNRNTLHLPDGPEQIARDLQFASMLKTGHNPDRWGDVEVQRFLWEWDSEKAAREAVLSSGGARSTL